MHYNNPKSKRKNIFREIYDSHAYKNILQHRKIPKFPFLLDAEITNYCPLSCLFCAQNAMHRPKGFMSVKIFKKLADECAEHNTPIRLIRWGEPFMHSKIIEFAKYVKRKGLPLHITNNGLKITEKQMSELTNMELDSMIFSLQGATKQGYQIMRNNDRYDELKNNILRMVEIRGEKEKPFIHISSTTTDETNKEIKQFVDYWGSIVDSVGIGKTKMSRFSANQLKSFEVARKLEMLKEHETADKSYRPCTEVYQKLSVNWDGKVSCCCDDYDDYLIVGNLNNSTLQDIWNNSWELKTFRAMLDRGMFKSLALCGTCYHTYEEF